MGNPIQRLVTLGQSIWYDNIERRLIENGELKSMIENGDIRGLTSNPSIFNHAIGNSNDYDSALTPMAWSGFSATQIFEQLAIEDIRSAADLLFPVYAKTGGEDGYVSLEVSPHLAYDSQGTLDEARRLWNLVERPNLMIKIPATNACLPAIQQAIAGGININITLIFSLSRYLDVMEAYLSGLEARLAEGQPVDKIASVASFFVSRIDNKVDAKLEAILRGEMPQAEKAQKLLGKAAIANAKLAYQEFRRVFESDRFKTLKEKGARPQRPLWASTSTKNPAYPDTLYVDTLVGQHTVNTVPQNTLDAFRHHGQAELTVETGLQDASRLFGALLELGISIDQVTEELEAEGVKAFADAYSSLLKTIEYRRVAAVRQLGVLANEIPPVVADLQARDAVRRMFEIDPTLWTQDAESQAEIRIRLGWLGLPESSRALLPELDALTKEIRMAGYSHALLLGMGGSSLAPEVLARVFGMQSGLDLAILDSTEPGQVMEAERRSSVAQTVYLVASKSGGTAEVNAFMEYFWDKAQGEVGERAGDHFIAITDPGTSLEKLARQRGFRKILFADAMVGGRYSALTAFGLLPAALMGIDVSRLLENAAILAKQCTPDQPYERNPGLVLGAIMGRAVLLGRDKLTIIADPALASIGSWMEQMIAESCGKQGIGIIPVDGERLAGADAYGDDRLFIYLRRAGDLEQAIDRLLEASQPVLVFSIDDIYKLSAEFYRWEFATAIACVLLRVNAFDQPDVQDAKTRTNAKIAAYRAQGRFDEGKPVWSKDGIDIYASQILQSRFDGIQGELGDVLERFLSEGKPGDYVALNVYLPRTALFEHTLPGLQEKVHNKTKLATTLGFGPRFLHSTGQLHKGGPNKGLFLQITAEPDGDVDIPEHGLSFGALIRGQALGDFEALEGRGRRALRIHLSSIQDIGRVIEAI